jgi:signal transduction histidine kinase
MSRLDFSNHYAVNGKDEIAELGSSINTMSSALEKTISDLKTANLQLMSDYEQKMKQSEARRAFISNVSHELKTPISLIQTYAEGLTEGIAAGVDNRDFYCEVIVDEANKMSTLIKKMTMLMQLETGKEELVIERFDISELIANILQKNQPRFEEKQVTVKHTHAQPIYVWADEFLIENVLSNFLSNALNHVNQQGRIEVFLTPVENNRVRISVFNSGNCIPEEDLPRIWESFYKVDKARTRAYGGTGIGLSVVSAIMIAHRMPYNVLNKEDGVEFYIELES